MKLLTTVFVSLQVKAHRAGVDQPFTQPLMEMNRKEWLRRHFCFQRSGALQSLQPLGPDVRKLQRQLVYRSPRSLRRIFITLVSTCVHAYERAWKGQRTTQIQSIRSHTPHWKQGLSLTWSSLSRRGCLGNDPPISTCPVCPAIPGFSGMGSGDHIKVLMLMMTSPVLTSQLPVTPRKARHVLCGWSV